MGHTTKTQGGHKVDVHTKEQYGGTERKTYVDGTLKERAHHDEDGTTHEYGTLRDGTPSKSYKK